MTLTLLLALNFALDFTETAEPAYEPPSTCELGNEESPTCGKSARRALQSTSIDDDDDEDEDDDDDDNK